ncbi:hypothetical protein LXL04_024477 [Taraxacum kok-saghyz]
MVNDWQQVRRKHNQYQRSNDDGEIRVRGSGESSLSFYVTNLPKDIKTNELWNWCATLGTVVDVYIAQKLSKMGRRFGFVRFIKNLKLDYVTCMWFGNYHVFASIARFPKKDRVIANEPVNKKVGTQSKAGVTTGRSYAKAVSGENPPITVPKKIVRSVSIGGRELTGLTDVQSTVLAEVREPTSIPNLLNLCREEGFANLKIRYVGGLWVWISCETSKVCKKLRDNVDMQGIFSKLHALHKDFVIHDRLAWVEIIGLPMCAWNPCVFKKVASIWGVVLFSDDDESNCMSIGKVCIQTS